MYRIVITKEDEKTVTKQEWRQLYADQATAEAAGAKSTNAYVDKIEEVVQETQLLDQRVEELDMAKVIRAINNLDAASNSGIGQFMAAGNMPGTPSKPETEQPDGGKDN